MRFAWLSLSLSIACAAPAQAPAAQAPTIEIPAHTQALIDAYRNREAMIAAERAQPTVRRCESDDTEPVLREKYLRRVGGCVEEPMTNSSPALEVAPRTQWPALYAALDARTSAVETCIRHAHAFWELQGELHTRIELDAKGRIEAVRTARDDARRDEVACCVRNALRQARLPAPGRALALAVSTPYAFASTSVRYRDAHLDKASIKQTIERHLDDVRVCYDAAVKAGLKAGGRVTVKFVIGPDGAVSRAEVEEDTLNAPSTACCIVDHLRAWQFPRPAYEGVVVVSYPFTLQLGG